MPDEIKRNYIYRIPPIFPLEHRPPGAWGFGVELDTAFAKKLRRVSLDESFYEHLEKIGNSLIKDILPSSLVEKRWKPYSFVEGSSLLHYVKVPGNACDLCLEHFCQNDFFENNLDSIHRVNYTPHNIDSKDQAFALLSLWINWANSAQDFIGY